MAIFHSKLLVYQGVFVFKHVGQRFHLPAGLGVNAAASESRHFPKDQLPEDHCTVTQQPRGGEYGT